MLQTLLSAVTAKAALVAAAGATVAGGAALVVLPDAAEDGIGTATEVVEGAGPDGRPLAASAPRGIEGRDPGARATAAEAAELDDAVVPDPVATEDEPGDDGRGPSAPEDTFAATVHQLQEEHPDRGRDFGQAVAEAARDHAAERRDSAPGQGSGPDGAPAGPPEGRGQPEQPEQPERPEPPQRPTDPGAGAPPADVPPGPPEQTPAGDRPGR